MVLTFLKWIRGMLFLAVLGALGWFFVNYYSFIFSKNVKGEVVKVERVDMPVALLPGGGSEMNTKVFSFAVAIKDPKTGEIFTASSEDRQWAVVDAGKCAEAEYFPYPPWDLSKKGTYHGARLVKLYECGSAL